MKNGFDECVGHVFGDEAVDCAKFLLIFVELHFIWMFTQFEISVI